MKFLIYKSNYKGDDMNLNFFNDLEKNNKFDKGLLGGIQDFIEDLANSLKTLLLIVMKILLLKLYQIIK